MRTPVPCFRCGKELENIMEPGSGNQPSCGLEFSTPGHFGSREFDPMNGTSLVINVCDECLTWGREEKRGRVLSLKAAGSTPLRPYQIWRKS